MNDRYLLKQIFISPLKVEEGRANHLEEYPPRICVIDTLKKKAIDIESKLSYDYVEIKNQYYIDPNSIKNLKKDERIAIRPIELFGFYNDYGDIYMKANSIVEKLEDGEVFRNGNSVLTNDQYLSFIKRENCIMNNKVKKLKKYGK